MIVVHHLASSGGTIFSTALLAQGGCALVSEVSPYYSVVRADRFSPTTPLEQYLARHHGEIPKEQVLQALEEHFRAQLRQLHALVGPAKTLALREWSHGDFFVSNRFSSSILPLIDFCRPLSLTLIRHPVDCFLSGRTYDAWSMIHSAIPEFCRRYLQFCRFFLEREGMLVVKYEEFAQDPDRLMEDLAPRLGLAFNPLYQRELGKYRLSGSSGRFSTDKITPRPRRPLSEAERASFLACDDYRKACELACYPVELGENTASQVA